MKQIEAGKREKRLAKLKQAIVQLEHLLTRGKQ
jgi:hypothetical protein